MKLVRILLICWIAIVTGAVSCSKISPVIPSESAVIDLRMTRSNLSGTQGDIPVETVVASIRVYIFNGDKLEQMRLFTGPGTDIGQMIRLRTKAGNAKSVYVLLNEPAAAKIRLDNIESPAAFRAMTYTLSDFMGNGADVSADDLEPGTPQNPAFLLPWCGEAGPVAVSAEQTTGLTLELKRIVARVDLYLRREMGSTINCRIDAGSCLQFSGLSGTGFFVPGADNPPVAGMPGRIIRRIRSVDLSAATHTALVKSDYTLAYSFYVPEQNFLTVGSRPQAELRRTNWEGYIPDDYPEAEPFRFRFGDGIIGYNNRIERNTVYTLYATLSQKGFSVDAMIPVLDWTGEEQQGDIG